MGRLVDVEDAALLRGEVGELAVIHDRRLRAAGAPERALAAIWGTLGRPLWTSAWIDLAVAVAAGIGQIGRGSQPYRT
jgi:hypothetical protein